MSSAEQIDIDLADLKISVSEKEAEYKKLRHEKKRQSRATKEPASGRANKALTTQTSRSKDTEISAAKPQSLLSKFVEAEDASEDEDQIPFDDMSKTTVESHNEKRVRWHDAKVGADDVTEKAHNLKPQQSQSKSERSGRRFFGSGKRARGAAVDDGDKSGTNIEGVKKSSSRDAHSGRSRGAKNEHAQGDIRKSSEEKRSSKSSQQASKVGEKRAPFAAMAASKRNEAKGNSKRSRSTSSKKDERKKPISSRDDAKHGDTVTTAETKPRKRSILEKKILKRPRGTDDSSVATKSTKRSFKKHSTEQEKAPTLSQATQDSKKRRRRPKNKGFSLFKNGMPDISFA